ncbi:hypothetical protein BCR36DRAFT_222681, partial [Piromyces finnis]
ISTLLNGSDINIRTINSYFHNITSFSNPIIYNLYNSYLYFENSKISNISSINNKLFNEQAELHFKNTIFENIESNSINVIEVYSQPLTFDSCTFNNIICYGDANASSLIKIDSVERKNKYIFNDLSINNCKSNSDLIKIAGNDVQIEISHTTIKNIFSYGSVINDIALKSFVKIKNSNFTDNTNINKVKCGIVSIYGDSELLINNSNIINNESKTSGGFMCINNVNFLDINISSSNFENNHGLDGGAFYINKGTTMDSISSIRIYNTLFKNNVAYNFGGAIYSDIEMFNITDINNVKFIGNNAYAGGSIYIKNDNANI